MKRVLMLGGADIQVSAIKLAKEMGFYVITCDYLPDNPGHKWSHEYHNVSTTDMNAVLSLAEQLQVDGIVAYASDPAALTAAYVAEKLNLPTNPFTSVELFSRKDLFRKFLIENKFNVPLFKACSSYEEAYHFINEKPTNYVIKPVDSSGSKGVFVVHSGEDFSTLFETSMSFSRAKIIIVEEFITKKGMQIGGDGFVVNGELVFRSFGDIHFSSSNPLLPCSVSIPTSHSNEIQNKVHLEVQRCLRAGGIQMGALNFDIMVDANDDVYILEIGPRNGGNMIPELVDYRTGVDMKVYTLKSAVGEDCSELKMVEGEGYYSHYVIHSRKSGIVNAAEHSKDLDDRLLYIHENFKPGDQVSEFKSSANRLGIMLLKYRNMEDMFDMISNMNEHYQLKVS